MLLETINELKLEQEEEQVITIKTCDIRGNELFKNYQPILEIQDKIVK